MGSLAKKLRQSAAPPVGSKLYHYTVADYLPAIIGDGLIWVAETGIPASERPCVWFSFHPDWEETANKGAIHRATGVRKGLSREETSKIGGGLARIEIRPENAPHNWVAYLRKSGVGGRHARGLEAAAREVGSDPGLWRVSFEPVAVECWIAIEINKDGSWKPYAEWIKS